MTDELRRALHMDEDELLRFDVNDSDTSDDLHIRFVRRGGEPPAYALLCRQGWNQPWEVLLNDRAARSLISEIERVRIGIAPLAVWGIDGTTCSLSITRGNHAGRWTYAVAKKPTEVSELIGRAARER